MHLDPTTANVLDELATPMLRLDPAGVVSAANIAAAGWLGVGRKRLLGLPLTDADQLLIEGLATFGPQLRASLAVIEANMREIAKLRR